MSLRTPLVTVCCLAYNQVSFIRQCLEGFVMQKTNFEFEVIVHDDFSDDGTQNIIKEYEKRYPHIIKPIYEKENQYSKKDGSLKRILDDNSKGKYIAICEGDDYWIDPFKLQKQVDFMEAHPDFSACYTNSKLLYSDGSIKDAIVNVWDVENTEDIILNHTDFSGDNITLSPGHTSTILYRNFLLEPYPKWTNGVLTGDFLLFTFVSKYGKAKFINDFTSVYRQNPKGVSSSNFSYIDTYKARLYVYKHLKPYFNHKFDKAINKVIVRYCYVLGKLSFKVNRNIIDTIFYIIKMFWYNTPEATKILIRKK